MKILGINAFHGDSSAALLSEGSLVAAVEEERLNRIKHWAGLPVLSANACLSGQSTLDLDHIAISRDPQVHLGAKLTRLALHPTLWTRASPRARNLRRLIRAEADLYAAGLGNKRCTQFHYVEHHRAHMASAFFASPFEEAAIVSIDGFGDFSSIMWGVGKGNGIQVLGSVQFPHSLGIFYTAFTQLLGFLKYGDEYKMMGLAAYGEPRFKDKIANIVQTLDGQCKLDLRYFVHHTRGDSMTWDDQAPHVGLVYSGKLVEAFGQSRVPGTEIGQKHADLAASVQAVLETNYFAILNHVFRRTGQKTLCLAGGVALNCVANGMIFEKTPFQDVYVQPAAHDAGTSIGAALYVQHQVLGLPRSFVMRHVYYGPQYSNDEVRRTLEQNAAEYRQLEPGRLIDATAQAIADGKIVGWFQGRMEFGPRALGNRSILADPRRKEMKDTLNKRIKYREPFRPFCPSILAEATSDYFEVNYPSPFMVMAYKIKPRQRDRIPAVTHGDGTGRLQTVEKDVNPLYWELIKRFDEMTGVPVVLNTSFNENEPIVNTPAEALDCFLRTQMDVLVLGPYFLTKTENHQVTEDRRNFAEV